MTRFFIPALLLLACAAPLAAQSRAELLLSDAPAPRNRRCDILRRTPREYAAALDSVGLRQTVGLLPGVDSAGSVLYSVRWDEQGNPLGPTPIERSLSAAYEVRLREAVTSSIRRVQASQPWALRVRINAGPTTSVRIGRSERCRVGLEESGSRGTETVTVMITESEVAELRACTSTAADVEDRTLSGASARLRLT